MPKESADVVVIGGGVSGLSSAFFLAKAGKDVVVVEKGTVGSEASGRNGGMISERTDEPDLIPLAVESIKLWATLDDELGYPTEFIHQGRIQIAVSEEEMGDLYAERDEALRHAISVELLDPSQIQDLIPGISERTLGGLFFANGGHANPQRSVQAFAWAFQDLGGRLYQNTAVTGFEVLNDKITSVETTAGRIATEFVVAAARPPDCAVGRHGTRSGPSRSRQSRDSGDCARPSNVRHRSRRERPIRSPSRQRQPAFRRRSPRVDRCRSNRRAEQTQYATDQKHRKAASGDASGCRRRTRAQKLGRYRGTGA